VVPQVVAIPFCVRGSIPASAETALRGLGTNNTPTEKLLAKAHIILCDYMRQIIHCRRAIETATLGPHGTHGIATAYINRPRR
jgi:hypothetical protein